MTLGASMLGARGVADAPGSKARRLPRWVATHAVVVEFIVDRIPLVFLSQTSLSLLNGRTLLGAQAGWGSHT